MKAIAKSAKPTSIISSKSKSTRPITNPATRPTDHSQWAWIEEYIDCFDGKLSPVPEKFLDRLAKELVEYAETTPILRLEWFFVKKQMAASSGRKWAKRYNVFNKAYEEAQFILGIRREHLAMHRDITEGITTRSLYKFDPMYAEIRQDEIDVRKEIAIEVAKATAAAKVQADNDNRPGAIPLGPVNSKEYQEYVKQIEAMQADKDPVE